MSLLDFKKKKVRSSLNIMFGYNMIPVIKKPPRVTQNTATAIDYIFINSVTSNQI